MGGNKHLNKKQQKVLLELKFLYADLEYHEEVMVDAMQEFQTEFTKKAKEDGVILPKSEVESPPNANTELGFQFEEESKPDLEIPEEESKDDEELAEFQALFRKITKLTHPDLFPNDSEIQRKERIDKFIKAKKAVFQKDWFMLYTLAMEVNLELPKLGNKHLKWMEAEAARVKQAIQKIKGSLVWHWYHNEAKREFYMASYIKQFNKVN